DRGHRQRAVVHRLGIRWSAARAGARRAGADGGPASVLLEKRKVEPRQPAPGTRSARLLGIVRLPRPRRSLERAALPGRLTSMRSLECRIATGPDIRPETPTVTTFRLQVPGWQPHLAGQHYDLRLTAEDG